MASLQEIRRKIGSVKNTQKITKAMQMVAAAKFKKAQDRILAARPYAQKMGDVLKNLSAGVNPDSHPLLKRNQTGRVELIVVTADRGLCGGFNANILRRAQIFLKEQKASGAEVGISVIGRKSRDFFKRRNIQPRREWVQIFDKLTFTHGSEIGRDVVEATLSGELSEVHILYNEFKSVMVQKVRVQKILPVEPPVEDGGASDGSGTGSGGNYLYEPDETELLAHLLPKYVEVQVFRALMESAAGELGARMSAMDAATRNAGELIKKMTLVYNKTRQNKITMELMDIVGGAEAMRGT